MSDKQAKGERSGAATIFIVILGAALVLGPALPVGIGLLMWGAVRAYKQVTED